MIPWWAAVALQLMSAMAAGILGWRLHGVRTRKALDAAEFFQAQYRMAWETLVEQRKELEGRNEN